MTWAWAFEQYGRSVLSRPELLAVGATKRSLEAAVAGGFLIRARRDRYLLPTAGDSVIQAIRVGGRVACVSSLQLADVFVVDSRWAHIHMETTMSRSRSPRSRFIPLTEFNRDGVELHWSPLFDPTAATDVSVGLPDALAQSFRCQKDVHAIAALDNALFKGLVTGADVADIFRALPSRLAHLRSEVDGRAESGQETVLRTIVRRAGLNCDLQVNIPGVGRVDMVVEGRLVLEADSRLAHDGWERHVEDRRRDLALARLGYPSLRPAYQHTMNEPQVVREAILGLLRSFGA